MNYSAKKLLVTGLLLLVATVLSAQLGLELRPGFNDELCPGFDNATNTVVIEVVNGPPFNPAPNTQIEYYWLITHESGEWIYQTNNAARPFLLSLAGEYTMRCQLLYVNQLTSLAYAAFWSAPLIIQTSDGCD